MKWLVGIDEVGRGPLAGPVCLGMCVAPADRSHAVWDVINQARDSKQLWSYEREFWHSEAKLLALSGHFYFYTTMVSHNFIDRRGITVAIRAAIQRNFRKANLIPTDCRILLDGSLYAPEIYKDQQTIIRGDATEPIISLASIVAKVRRDRLMIGLARRFPAYGFEINKGYGTKDHIKALEIYGPCEFHRKSFLNKIMAQNRAIDEARTAC